MMRRAGLLGVAMWMLLASMPADACSWGNPTRRLQDEVMAYYNADVVFLARIGKVRSEPPTGDNPHWMLAAPYQVLEHYRGKPDPSGTLLTEDASRVGADVVPTNSCTGGAIGPSSEGRRVLVFATRMTGPGVPARYKLDRFSTTSAVDCATCGDTLQRMRLYGRFEQVAP